MIETKINGWTIYRDQDYQLRMYKSCNGISIQKCLGKWWNEQRAIDLINQIESTLIFNVTDKTNKIEPANNIPPIYIEGWRVSTHKGYFRITKTINSEQVYLHIGKRWSEKKALYLINRTESDPNYKQTKPVSKKTPKFRNWSICTRTKEGYVLIHRRIQGKQYVKYIGKQWNEAKANQIINITESMAIASS